MNIRNLTVLVSLFTLSACGGGAGTTLTEGPPTNTAPSVEAGTDTTIRLPVDTVDLDGTVTDDNIPAGVAVSTAWTVQSGPAGATFADPNSVDTTVTFAAEGTYVLELTADDSNLSASDTVTIVVEAAPAVASIEVTPASVSLFPGGVRQFDAAATDQYGDPIATTPVWSATGGTIDQTGSYTAGTVLGDFEVTATDGAVSGTADVTIAASPPTAEAGGPYSGVEGTPVALDGSASSDPNDDIVSYDWDLDNDGAYDDASGASATFAAASSGVFTIGLQVTDADGASNTDAATVTVANVAPTAVAGGPYSGDQGANIALDASASSDPGNDIASYAWDLDNDGAYDDATGAMTVFNSPSVGDFTVGLQVTDVDGDSGTATTTVTVNNVAPTADAGGPYSGDQGADIALDASASSDPGNDIVSYEWDLDNDGAYDDATGV
ncbi:MAG: PKD domain-containing protein, partial [Proteobacteria bacterium]|nr:PKD domain-containing protein [Pseudomonadota bacterium]